MREPSGLSQAARPALLRARARTEKKRLGPLPPAAALSQLGHGLQINCRCVWGRVWSAVWASEVAACGSSSPAPAREGAEANLPRPHSPLALALISPPSLPPLFLCAGALVGAGTTAAYYNGVDVMGLASSALARAAARPGGGGGSSAAGPDVDRLVALVERLALDGARGRGGGGVTVVHGSGGSGSGLTVLILLAGGGVVAARLAGVSLADCLFTTRAQLKASIAGVAGGVDALASKLAGARAYLTGRLDDLAADQAATGAAVGRVEGDVGRARAELAAVHGEVRGLAAGLAALEAGQRESRAALNLANEGVFLLCRVVCDLMRGGPADARGKPVSAAAAALDEFVGRSAGLAAVLGNDGSGGRHGLRSLLGGDGGGGAYPAAAGATAADGGLDDDALGLGSGLGVYGRAAGPPPPPPPATPSHDLGTRTRRPMPANAGAGAFGWLF